MYDFPATSINQLFSRLIIALFLLVFVPMAQAGVPQVSSQTGECLECHTELHPGLVQSWQNRRHSEHTTIAAMQLPILERRVSTTTVDEHAGNIVVGCYECHSLNSDKHTDAFEHNGYTVNIVVSPEDCATCHPVEVDQYSDNIMSHAYANLVDNSLYQDFMQSVNCSYSYREGSLVMGEADPLTEQESCLYCHGTEVTVVGFETRDTDFGEYQFPVLSGWPNQGVGRINPDGSQGACTSCHPRHDFSIKTARQPYTCSECHKGPDVPASKVYEVSKHGHIAKSQGDSFNYEQVPWRVGEDFTAPTCATCHVSLLVTPDNTVVAERTHQFSDRLSWRLFGVPYAHPHPLEGNLTNIRNSRGLPIATELDGSPVAEFLISGEEQERRVERMKAVCAPCHSTQWIDNHFLRLDNCIQKTNDLTNVSTSMMMDIWKNGGASGLPQGDNIFDEAIERTWASIWLFHANTVRFSSAMSGGGDYTVFADGRYQVTEQLYRLQDELKRLQKDK